jgi:hypothetical protein
MNLGKYIFGVREEYFTKVSDKETARQFRVYNNLSLMFYTLIAISTLAGLIYGLVLFNSWWIAIGVGLFLGGISFTLLLLVFFLNMTTNYQNLYLTMTDMNPIFEEHENDDLKNLSDERAEEKVQAKKMLLRETNQEAKFDHFHLSSVVTSIIKVTLILIISCVVANSLEFLIFHKSLNSSLNSLKNNETLVACAKHELTENNDELNRKITLARWTLSMLKEDANAPFILIKSKSLLLSMEILSLSIGKSKVVLDIVIALLFLTPFVLLKKSKEYAGGIFLKEAALYDIQCSHMFFLISERERRKIKEKIQNEYPYNELIKKSVHEA